MIPTSVVPPGQGGQSGAGTPVAAVAPFSALAPGLDEARRPKSAGIRAKVEALILEPSLGEGRVQAFPELRGLGIAAGFLVEAAAGELKKVESGIRPGLDPAELRSGLRLADSSVGLPLAV